MDFKTTGGPAYPTLSGGEVDENTFRFEGLTLFDYFVGKLLQRSHMTPFEAVTKARETMEYRNNHLYPPEDQT